MPEGKQPNICPKRSSQGVHFVLLLAHGGRPRLAGIYAFDEHGKGTSRCVYAVSGAPAALEDLTTCACFKYDSVTKSFRQQPLQDVRRSCDAVSLLEYRGGA